MIIGKQHQCQFCEEQLENFAQFNAHLTQHLDEKRFRCTEKDCNKLFKDIDSYLNHTRNHTQITQKANDCKSDQVIASNSSLSGPEDAHQLKDWEKGADNAQSVLQPPKFRRKPKFECVRCKIKFASQNSYTKHMKFISHETTSNNQTFMDDSIAQKPLSAQLDGAGSDKITCNFCDKSFKSEFYLKSHTLIHTGDLPFGCDKCSARFNRKDKLKRHGLIHGDSKRYQCPFRENAKCKKEFYRMDKLQSHIKTHGNNKQTKCRHCNQMFSNTTSLRNHVSEDHAQISNKPMKCFECDETFKLEKKRRIHHGKVHGIIHLIDGSSYKNVQLSDDNLLDKTEKLRNLNEHESQQQDNIIVYIQAE